MDSDSDSDDSILKEIAAGSTFKKPRKSKQENASARANKILDEALQFSTENLAQQMKISQIKRVEVDTEELQKKTQQIKENGNKKQKVSNDEDPTNGDAALDSDRRKFLAKIADTELSSNLGARRTLFVIPCDSSDLPRTSGQAIGYLDYLLQNLTAEDGVTKIHRKAIMVPLTKHLQNGTLAYYLSEATIFEQCRTNSLQNIPKKLMEWLFFVSCAGGGGGEHEPFSIALANLSYGAFHTLSKLWENGIGPHGGAILTLTELLTQLRDWFGFSMPTTTTTKPPDSGTDEGVGNGIKGFCSFLKLWGLALDRGFVAVNKSNLEQDASNCVAALTLAGIDRVFHTHKYDLRILTPLQRLLATTLDLSSYSFGHETGNGYIDGWMTKTAEMVDAKLSQLGPGVLGSEDSDDVGAWLSSSLAVRLTNQLSNATDASTTFTLQLAFQAIKRVLYKTKEDWSKDVQKLLDGLSLDPKQAGGTVRWHALATSYLALCALLQQQRMFSEHSAKCLAIVDLSQSCLHAGLILFDEHLICPNLEDDEDEDIENIENEKTDDLESNAMHNLFEMFEARTQEIERLSQKKALTHPHLRRVNFQVTCMRQYFRLAFKANHQESTVTQSTLDNFFSPKGAA